MSTTTPALDSGLPQEALVVFDVAALLFRQKRRWSDRYLVFPKQVIFALSWMDLNLNDSVTSLDVPLSMLDALVNSIMIDVPMIRRSMAQQDGYHHDATMLAIIPAVVSTSDAFKHLQNMETGTPGWDRAGFPPAEAIQNLPGVEQRYPSSVLPFCRETSIVSAIYAPILAQFEKMESMMARVRAQARLAGTDAARRAAANSNGQLQESDIIDHYKSDQTAIGSSLNLMRRLKHGIRLCERSLEARKAALAGLHAFMLYDHDAELRARVLTSGNSGGGLSNRG